MNCQACEFLNDLKPSKNRFKDVWIKRGSLLLQRLFGIIKIVDDFKKEYQQVKCWYISFQKIAEILEPSDKKTSAWVEKRLKQYLKQIEAHLTDENDVPFVQNLKSYSKGFWKGLFTFYDHPMIPRTNNELELFFRKIKQKHRRITGSRTWNRYIIRHGENIVFVENVKNQKEAIQLMQKVNYEEYKKTEKEWKKRLAEQVKQWRFKRDPNVYLSQVEKTWIGHN